MKKPYVGIAMTKPEARDLLELLDGVDRKGGIACGMRDQIRNYDNIAYLLRNALRKARMRRFPNSGRRAA